MSDSASIELLHIYEIEEPEGTRFLVCFLEPVLAGARGIESKAVVGEFVPKPDGEFDPETFVLNPEFVAGFEEYMNALGIDSPELIEQARQNPGSELFLVDPRHGDPASEPEVGDLLGWISIDDDGTPVDDSFHYNEQHLLFDPLTGPSHILLDRRFYDWLHPLAEPS